MSLKPHLFESLTSPKITPDVSEKLESLMSPKVLKCEVTKIRSDVTKNHIF